MRRRYDVATTCGSIFDILGAGTCNGLSNIAVWVNGLGKRTFLKNSHFFRITSLLRKAALNCITFYPSTLFFSFENLLQWLGATILLFLYSLYVEALSTFCFKPAIVLI